MIVSVAQDEVQAVLDRLNERSDIALAAVSTPEGTKVPEEMLLLSKLLSRRLLLLTLVLAVLAMLIGGFFSELAIINGREIVVALVADFLRYALGLFALLVITTSVAQDYEFRQFEIFEESYP